MQTIAIIPVLPFGVVQLGSTQMVSDLLSVCLQKKNVDFTILKLFKTVRILYRFI